MEELVITAKAPYGRQLYLASQPSKRLLAHNVTTTERLAYRWLDCRTGSVEDRGAAEAALAIAEAGAPLGWEIALAPERPAATHESTTWQRVNMGRRGAGRW